MFQFYNSLNKNRYELKYAVAFLFGTTMFVRIVFFEEKKLIEAIVQIR